jgi:hypothetical protein
VASSESRFVVGIGIGYWAAMLLIRSVTAFELLNTRMMMPAYPLVLMSVIAILLTLAEHLGLSRRLLMNLVAVLFVGSLAVVGAPRSAAAGGPRLHPGPPPVWVEWAAAHTPAGAPIVGNRTAEFNFYLQRPTYSFQVFAVYRTGNRFDRDCQLISKHLSMLDWNHVYFILHAEDGEFDPSDMGRRYGPTIEKLLKGDTPLPLRLITRQAEFAAYEINGLQWNCDRD